MLKSCWHMTATKRPTASEVVELLSNTPRLICPCIDIPLASVQVERTDSLELIPSVRKPSGSVSRTNKPVLNSTNKRLKDHSGSSGYQTQNSNHNASSESTNNAPTPKSTNGAYSPMSGLLNYHSHSNGRTNTESPHPRIDFSGTICCYQYHNVYRNVNIIVKNLNHMNFKLNCCRHLNASIVIIVELRPRKSTTNPFRRGQIVAKILLTKPT